MIAVIGSADGYLSAKLGHLAAEAGFRVLRTHKIERVEKELKLKQRLAIIDMNWVAAQAGGVLRRLVNIGRIGGNRLICMCPNKDEGLKKIARSAYPEKVFIRYDMHSIFLEYLATASKPKTVKW